MGEGWKLETGGFIFIGQGLNSLMTAGMAQLGRLLLLLWTHGNEQHVASWEPVANAEAGGCSAMLEARLLVVAVV
jgi:hypothetical protein